ncbi:jg14023 [Pararge aegeria aegeria]|uniref:Jg14023 protein n=1 Tax=Pararge aegeria aegeria TaxID=348720 RepID=A0A8S4R4Z5_9NEOP|nr:jg14023 [Pararge aegeria aegeria]
MDSGVPRCWNVNPAPVNAALVNLNQLDRRHPTSLGEPLDTRGPESWSLERPAKDLCPAVDANDDDCKMVFQGRPRSDNLYNW